MNITVITPSLPTRTRMLSECIQSVAHQTLKPVEHLIGVDIRRHGSARIRNQLLGAASGSWVAFLDDDDLMYPHHLEILRDRAISDDADLVYSRPDGYNPTQPFDPIALRQGNFIPVTVLVRTKLLWDVGGFVEDARNGWEDWAAWLKLLDVGCRFAYEDTATWHYRLHEGSKTHRGDAAY